MTQSASLPHNPDSQPKPEQARYQQLRGLLDLVETLLFPVTICIAAIGLVIAFIGGNNLALIIGGASVASAFVTYAVTLIWLEVIRVVLDIESSTRQTAAILQSKVRNS